MIDFKTLSKLNIQYPNDQEFAGIIRKLIWKNENNNNMEMMSLYDYLGHAAGSDVGQQVAYAAAKAGVITETRQVSNPVYKGPVMLYPKSFLDLYFKGGLNEGTSGKQLLKG